MNKVEQMRNYVARNPGSTVTDIADGTGIDKAYVASKMTRYFQEGRLRREKSHCTTTNVVVYKYFPIERVVAQEKNVTCQSNPSKPGKFDALVDDLATSIAALVADRMRAKLAEEISSMIQSTAPPPTKQAFVEQIKAFAAAQLPAPKATKQRVLIAGLLPQQAGMISTEFGEVFDLTFWKDEAPEILKSRAAGADHVFLFSGKTGHWVEDCVKASGTPFTRCLGGMSSLRQQLTEFFVKED